MASADLKEIEALPINEKSSPRPESSSDGPADELLVGTLLEGALGETEARGDRRGLGLGGVPAVVLAGSGSQQRHQVQVGDPELGQVVEVVRQRARRV